MKNPFSFQFLNQSYGSWFVFLIVMTLFLGVWSGVLRHIKGAI